MLNLTILARNAILPLLLLFSVTAKAVECPDCVIIRGERVKLKEVGAVIGSYHYIITDDNRKSVIPANVVSFAEIALVMDVLFYINDNYNYTVLNLNEEQ